MTIKDLKTGDIIVHRTGHLSIYIERDNEGVIICQHGGYDPIYHFNEDLTDAMTYPGVDNIDIMQVYRADSSLEAISFTDYTEGDLIFERDPDWTRPAAED